MFVHLNSKIIVIYDVKLYYPVTIPRVVLTIGNLDNLVIPLSSFVNFSENLGTECILVFQRVKT